MPFPSTPGTALAGELTPGDPGAGLGALFPQAPLGLGCDLLLGTSGWTAIPHSVYQRQGTSPPVTLSRGRADESVQAQPATAAFQLNNRGGPFSEYNPTGPYYGLLGRNTPVRFSVPGQSTSLRMEDDAVSYAATGAIAPPAGDFEVRVDLLLSGWASSVLVSQGLIWALLLDPRGRLILFVFTGGPGGRLTYSTAPLPFNSGRFSVRATYANSTGVVTFYYASSIDPGSWTQLGDPVVSFLTGAPSGSATALQVGADASWAAITEGQAVSSGAPANGYGQPTGLAWAPPNWTGMTGRVWECRLYQGIGGPYIADGIFSGLLPGTTSFKDAPGNTWTLAGTATVDARAYRYHGQLAALPQKWDLSGRDVWVPVTAAGPLRQAGTGAGGQGTTPPLQSSMTRGWRTAAAVTGLVAWWPCEDGSGAATAGSGLAAGAPMVPGSPPPSLGGSSVFPSASGMVSLNKGSLWGTVPAYTPPSPAAAVMRVLVSVPSGGDTDQGVIARMHTSGTVYRLDFQYSTVNGGSPRLVGYDGSGNILFDTGYLNVTAIFTTAPSGLNGTPLYAQASLTTSGGNVAYQLILWQAGTAPAQQVAAGSVSGTVGAATAVDLNPKLSALLSGTAVGQVSVHTIADDLQTGLMAGPFQAWAGETDGLRFARLCREQGYGCRIAGAPSQGVAMGPQTAQTFVSLLAECETAGGGIMGEARDSLSLRYRTLGSLCGQSPVTLDYPSAQLGFPGADLEVIDDDQLLVNDITVTRSDGSVSGSMWTSSVTSGPMSTQAPPNGVGDYQQQANQNVFSDSQLPDAAGWLLHLGTVAEPRYPQVPVDLSRTELAALYWQVLGLDLGDYVAVTNPPPWLPPGPVKAVVWQAKEELGGFFLRQSYATLPESPYEVLLAGSGALTDSRDDTAGSTLASGVNSSATSLSVATSAGPLWTTAAGDFPLSIIIAGEEMTVTNITGSTSPQTFTVTRSVNGVVKAQAANAAVAVAQPCYLALA